MSLGTEKEIRRWYKIKKMKIKILTIGTAILLLLAAVFIGKFVFGGDEDAWVCQNGEWVKHGNPEVPMPLSGCGEETGAEQFISYTNQELGFSLQIPISWEGKYEVNVLSLDPKASGLDQEGMMSALFDFLPEEGETYMLFRINKVSFLGWERLQEEELFRGRKLTQADETVYYADLSIDNPFVGSDGDRYQELSADVNSILASFRIIE